MAIRLHRGWLLILLLAATGCANSLACASGLQVSPVSLTLRANQHAQGLWLSNTGRNVVHAQVRVYHWTQNGGTRQLTPSRALVISPPMLVIHPGQKQLVRVIRIGAPPSGPDAVEDAYRLAIDELPVDTKGKAGLNFVLHYSVPVFVEPAGKTGIRPRLQWNLQRKGDHVVLQVTNHGTGHAQLSRLTFVDRHGTRTTLDEGLLGYVLPGKQMHWTLKPSASVFAGGGTLHVRINREAVVQPVSLDTAAQ